MSESLGAILPALLFLLLAVPLAALLDELGFFRSVAGAIQARWREVPVLGLWLLAAATTATLNLDTTVVLLTPLYLELGRSAAGDGDGLGLALIPLFLAAFASSVIPVSNLTTLIVVERTGASVLDVLVNVGPASVAATVIGWLAYRRRWPTTVRAATPLPVDRWAVRVGGLVVAFLLVAFLVGPSLRLEPWLALAVADLVLVAITRRLPLRTVPVGTALVVGSLAVLIGTVSVTFPGHGHLESPVGAAVLTLAGAVGANLVNNLPATLLATEAHPTGATSLWPWLAGANTGGVLLPIGALANLLWLRILRREGEVVALRRYLGVVLPVGVPALLGAAATMALLAAVR